MRDSILRNRDEELKQNLENFQRKIKAAAERVSRRFDSVRFFAVTKKQTIDLIRTTIEAEIHCFGEKYALEATAKITAGN